jgi:DNA-directed RNA polymerase subunit RPC12/RpoP
MPLDQNEAASLEAPREMPDVQIGSPNLRSIERSRGTNDLRSKAATYLTKCLTCDQIDIRDRPWTPQTQCNHCHSRRVKFLTVINK